MDAELVRELVEVAVFLAGLLAAWRKGSGAETAANEAKKECADLRLQVAVLQGQHQAQAQGQMAKASVVNVGEGGVHVAGGRVFVIADSTQLLTHETAAAKASSPFVEAVPAANSTSTSRSAPELSLPSEPEKPEE